jgi:hypothetical protein
VAPYDFHASDPPLRGARLGYENPWVNLLALPVALLSSWALISTSFGRLLLVPVEIQFHELGHALMAWLSSRAALPLPFGFTFWNEEKSRFVALCMLFLIGVFTLHAEREKRWFGVGLGGALLLLFVWLSWIMPSERSLALAILGGHAGEVTLGATGMVAFHFPLPDRLRWDFFRFLALPPASAVWLSALRLWVGVRDGTRSLPSGSILGGSDASGDLERLIRDYGFSSAGITRTCFALCMVSGFVCLTVYGFFALRAARALSERQR